MFLGRHKLLKTYLGNFKHFDLLSNCLLYFQSGGAQSSSTEQLHGSNEPLKGKFIRLYSNVMVYFMTQNLVFSVTLPAFSLYDGDDL